MVCLEVEACGLGVLWGCSSRVGVAIVTGTAATVVVVSAVVVLVVVVVWAFDVPSGSLLGFCSELSPRMFKLEAA